jgi:hypothetical protein
LKLHEIDILDLLSDTSAVAVHRAVSDDEALHAPASIARNSHECDREIWFYVTGFSAIASVTLPSFLERRRPMSNLQSIAQRHRPDVWRDMIFIAGAALLTALSVGSLTSRDAGAVHARQWTLTVIEGNLEVSR